MSCLWGSAERVWGDCGRGIILVSLQEGLEWVRSINVYERCKCFERGAKIFIWCLVVTPNVLYQLTYVQGVVVQKGFQFTYLNLTFNAIQRAERRDSIESG